jgi:hypothetical protein
MGAIELRQGQVLIGPLFSEPMRVETVTANGAGSWSLGLVGQSSEQFRRVTLTAEQLAVLTVRGLKALRMRKRASLKGSVMSINTASDSRLREATTPWSLRNFGSGILNTMVWATPSLRTPCTSNSTPTCRASNLKGGLPRRSPRPRRRSSSFRVNYTSFQSTSRRRTSRLR